MENLLSKTDDEIIEICKKYNITYLQKNGKKPYKKDTLIKNIMKSGKFIPSKDEDKPFIQNISNKEALKNKIHDIHNFLRNNGVGYGMNALKVFNVLYGLKKIEENGLLEKFELSNDCKFSELVKLSKTHSSSDININQVVSGKILKQILDELSCQYKDDKTLRNFLFYEIPQSIKPNVLPYLVKEIDMITEIEKSCNVNLSGKIYEYFIGRDRTAISELGAYFTDRHIVDYIYNNLLKPSINDKKEIGTMIDMFGGSGGFTIGYINYLQENFKDIDWSKEIHKIYHFDMNEDVIKSAALELLCLTKELPNMDYNIKQVNTFYHEFYDKDNEPQKYKYIITNPPYGGDKNEESDTSNKNKKIKKYIEEELKTLKDDEKIKNRKLQMKMIDDFEKEEKIKNDNKKVSLINCSMRLRDYAKENKLTGNDKESCSLIQMMNLLDVDGTAIGVLKEGVFFDKKYKDLREVLIKKFNIRKVISVPSDQFENTTTKTSIIIFDNTEEKTSVVEFYDLVVNKYTDDKFEEINNNIILTECKDDIYSVTDALISIATLDELLENPISSLNGKDYKLETLQANEDYELVKLGDICEIKIGGTPRRNVHEYWKNGNNTWVSIRELKNNIIYNSTEKITDKGVNESNVKLLKKGSVLFSFKLSIGKLAIAGTDLYTNEAIAGLNCLEKSNINNHYLYYYLYCNDYENDGNGTIGKGSLNSELLKNLKIPIPKSQEKIKEWTDKISLPFNEKNTKQLKIEELEEFIKNKIKDIEANEGYELVKLGDICEIKIGGTPRRNVHEYWKNGNNTWVSIRELKNNIIYNSTEKITDKGVNESNVKLLKKGYVLFSFKLSIGKLAIAGTDLYTNEAIAGLNCLEKSNINNHYLYYYLYCNDYENDGNGTIGKGSLNSELLKKLKIKIPKNEKIIKDLEPIFNEISQLKEDINNANTLFEKYIKELREDAIKCL